LGGGGEKTGESIGGTVHGSHSLGVAKNGVSVGEVNGGRRPALKQLMTNE